MAPGDWRFHDGEDVRGGPGRTARARAGLGPRRRQADYTGQGWFWRAVRFIKAQASTGFPNFKDLVWPGLVFKQFIQDLQRLGGGQVSNGFGFFFPEHYPSLLPFFALEFISPAGWGGGLPAVVAVKVHPEIRFSCCTRRVNIHGKLAFLPARDKLGLLVYPDF